LSCKEVVEAVTDYLEGTMAADDLQRLDAHLAECPHCVRYLEQMGLMLAALGRLPEESISPDLRDRLVESFRGWRERRV
jgi:anti-sigma factor (TIGR02949 family)